MRETEINTDYIMETLNAYQRTEALCSAIEIGLFGEIGRGYCEPRALAGRCGASERGVRMLCDYLVVQRLLTKSEECYGLTEQAARFLVAESDEYMGGAIGFLRSDLLCHGFSRLTKAVRAGGTAHADQGALRPGHEAWVEFARAMAPVMAPAARSFAALSGSGRTPRRVLDIAAGHGLFGIEIARRHPQAEIVAVDWPNVLELAGENARAAGVGDRYNTLPGDALEIDLGNGYDLVVLANILHHFDVPTCVRLLERVHAALDPGGRAMCVEYVPDEGRVSPPRAAGFALVMLATTPAGDAYTFAEYEEMLRPAGFVDCRLLELSGTTHRVIRATRKA